MDVRKWGSALAVRQQEQTHGRCWQVRIAAERSRCPGCGCGARWLTLPCCACFLSNLPSCSGGQAKGTSVQKPASSRSTDWQKRVERWTEKTCPDCCDAKDSGHAQGRTAAPTRLPHNKLYHIYGQRMSCARNSRSGAVHARGPRSLCSASPNSDSVRRIDLNDSSTNTMNRQIFV